METPTLIEKTWYFFRSVLGFATALVLLAMVALTVVDVVARYLFNSPVNGAFELTEMMLATVVFLALPLTTAAGEHIEVELLEGVKSRSFKQLMHWLSIGISAVVLLAISWRVWLHGLKLAGDGAVTNSLSLPLAPIGYLAAASCLISGLLFIFKPNSANQK